MSGLADIAAGLGIETTICSQPDALKGAGRVQVGPGSLYRCGPAVGYDIAARQKGDRDGCLCAESRDIGAYDTCAHGCVYSYAESDHDRAVAKLGQLAQS